MTAHPESRGHTGGMLGAGGFHLAAILTAALLLRPGRLLRPRPANEETEPTPETFGSAPG